MIEYQIFVLPVDRIAYIEKANELGKDGWRIYHQHHDQINHREPGNPRSSRWEAGWRCYAWREAVAKDEKRPECPFAIDEMVDVDFQQSDQSVALATHTQGRVVAIVAEDMGCACKVQLPFGEFWFSWSRLEKVNG